MKKLNVGIAGYGWAAEAHVAAIHATSNAHVTTICSARALDPAALSGKHSCPLRVVNRIEDVLAACYESARTQTAVAVDPSTP